MGRKPKKTTESGQSSSEGSQASIATKGAAGAGGKLYPSSDESPHRDSQKEKPQKKRKQTTTAAGGGQESGKSKQKTTDRDSSEEGKKQGIKQKGKSSRVGASTKLKAGKGGCCSVFCCVTVLSVLVAVVAAASYGAYMTYPDESMRFLEIADVELRVFYQIAREVGSKKLDEILVALGQKTPDETQRGQRSTRDGDDTLKEERREEEDEVVEETVIRENVPEEEADEEIVIREQVREDEVDEESVVREHVPEVHEEKKEAEEYMEVPIESKVDETVEGTDGRSEPEVDAWVAGEESLEKDVEKKTVREESTNAEEAVDEEITEEEVVGGDEEQTDESKGDEEVKHWETEQEEKVKGDTGSSYEELKESVESPATDSIKAEVPAAVIEDEVQADEQRVSEQVEERTEDVQVDEHDVPKQEVPEPEVVHQKVPEPEVPRVVIPEEEVLEPEVLDVEEADLRGPREENLVKEHLGEAGPVEPQVPVAEEHLGAAGQSEEPVKKEVPEQPVAFAGSDTSDTKPTETDLEHDDREGDVKAMKQAVDESVPVDAGAGEEKVLQPIPPVAEPKSQGHQQGDEIDADVNPAAQSAEPERVAEPHSQEDAAHERRQQQRFESKEGAGENVAAGSSEEKSEEDEIESQLDYLDGIVNMVPREAIEMYNGILDVFPENHRAVIGKAYALGVAANIEQNDDALEQSINEYLKVFSLPSVPKPQMVAAARACAEKQSLRGWGSAAAQTLKSLVAIYPDDLELYYELGQKYVINGAYEDARATFKEILNKNPNDAYAMLHLGYIMKLVDQDVGQSLDLMKTGLVAVPVTELKFYIELGESLTRTGRHNEAHEVYQLAVDRKLLPSVWQRSWYNIDGLTRQPWWTAEQTHNIINLQVLEDFWTVLRDEAMGILTNKSELFQPDSRDIIEGAEMKHMKLFINGRKMTENCDAAVKTCSLLDAFSNAVECEQCEVKFSVMHPGLHTRPHSGPTNCRITAQLPLIVDPQTRIRVADQTRTYTSGRFLIFDDSFEQELWVTNESFQLLLTVEMWHPDLGADLRKTLGPL